MSSSVLVTDENDDDDDRSQASSKREEEEVELEFSAMDANGDGMVTKKEYRAYRGGKAQRRKGDKENVESSSFRPAGVDNDAAQETSPPNTASNQTMRVVLFLLAIGTWIAVGQPFQGGDQISAVEQERRLKVLDTLPAVAAQGLRTRLKTMLRGAGGVSQRNTAMLLGGGDAATRKRGARAIHGILLGEDGHEAGLVLDASLYRNGADLAREIESHLTKHRGETIVVSVHGCHVPDPAVIYHMDKFFDEEYRGIASEGQRSQRVVLVLTGAFGGTSRASVQQAAAAHFKKDAFRAKLTLFAAFGE